MKRVNLIITVSILLITSSFASYFTNYELFKWILGISSIYLIIEWTLWMIKESEITKLQQDNDVEILSYIDKFSGVIYEKKSNGLYNTKDESIGIVKQKEFDSNWQICQIKQHGIKCTINDKDCINIV